MILLCLEIQLLAYPRAKSITIDFIGWEHERPVTLRRPSWFKRPSYYAGRFSEVIIRGLHGEQKKVVRDIVAWYVTINGRIGTTSSQFVLADEGELYEATPGVIYWETIEAAHPLLEETLPTIDDSPTFQNPLPLRYQAYGVS